MPILAFAGTGKISFYGVPKGCLVTAYHELPRVLNARGNRLAADTVDKVFSLAPHPATWSAQRMPRSPTATAGTRTAIEWALTRGVTGSNLCGVEPLDTKHRIEQSLGTDHTLTDAMMSSLRGHVRCTGA